MCTCKEFLREILDILANITGKPLVFSRMVSNEMGSKLHCSYELEFFVLICLNELKVSYDYSNHG